MKSIEYTCDICGERKTPQTGWTMASVSTSGRITFWRWNPNSSSNAKHLCSPECETKFLLQNTSPWRAESASPKAGTLLPHVGPEPYSPVKIDPFTPLLKQEEEVVQ